MGKKKSKKRGKRASTTVCTLPRSIAGVKVSRELRDAVDPVLRWATDPLVMEAVAMALLAGASALTGKSDPDGAVEARKAGESPGGGKGGDALGLAIAVAAEEIASRIVAAYSNYRRSPPGKTGQRSQG